MLNRRTLIKAAGLTAGGLVIPSVVMLTGRTADADLNEAIRKGNGVVQMQILEDDFRLPTEYFPIVREWPYLTGNEVIPIPGTKAVIQLRRLDVQVPIGGMITAEVTGRVIDYADYQSWSEPRG